MGSSVSKEYGIATAIVPGTSTVKMTTLARSIAICVRLSDLERLRWMCGYGSFKRFRARH